jgi:TfoX/Sxy family transcriptional regulator of competence genes
VQIARDVGIHRWEETMKFPKASPWVKTLFASLIEGLDCKQRQMFGYPCAFVNGQMFAGVFTDSIIVRLSETLRAELLNKSGTQIFDPMGGRPMREYVQLSGELFEDEEMLSDWIRKGYTYARSLPPKAPKKSAKPKKKKSSPTRSY